MPEWKFKWDQPGDDKFSEKEMQLMEVAAALLLGIYGRQVILIGGPQDGTQFGLIGNFKESLTQLPNGHIAAILEKETSHAYCSEDIYDATNPKQLKNLLPYLTHSHLDFAIKYGPKGAEEAKMATSGDEECFLSA